MKSTALVVAAALACCWQIGCNAETRNDAGTTVDSAGAKLERGAEKVGKGIEAAAEDVGEELKEAKIQAVVDNIKGLDSVEVDLAEDGAVTLSGSVATIEKWHEAQRLVASIKGVERLLNAITVGGTIPSDSARSVVDSVR